METPNVENLNVGALNIETLNIGTLNSKTSNAESSNVDISNCDREPIHIPGFIQPHGVLFAFEESNFVILQASDNTEPLFGKPAEQLCGTSLQTILAKASYDGIMAALSDNLVSQSPLHVFTASFGGTDYHALLHRYDGILILELEQAIREGTITFQNLYAVVSSSVSRMEAAPDTTAVCQVAVREMRRLTGLDKVMIYLFDEDWNGITVAEDRAEHMDPYLGLRFPASDIPRQARDLYVRNKVRLISDVYATPVLIVPSPNPLTNRSLDMSYSTLRSVSPIHIEYLKNMGVGASMSVSIIRDGKLAGLIACHHATVKYLPYEVRTACEFLGQVLGQQLTALERDETRQRKLRSVAINSQLLEGMAQTDNYVESLTSREKELLELTGAQGAAICVGHECILLGKTPTSEEVTSLKEWATSRRDEIFACDSLPEDAPRQNNISQTASGILAISISEVHGHIIMWFRPEVVRTVSWAGDPTKALDPRTQQLHPRKSFEVWKEIVHERAQPWSRVDMEAASELRAAIVGIVLKQAEERAQLSTELMQSNQELEAFSYSVSHDLRAPFRHIVGFSQLLQKRLAGEVDETSARYITTIADSANYAGTLVDNLLTFSRMGRSEMRQQRLDMNSLVREIRSGLTSEIGGRKVDWIVGEMPEVKGDLAMLRLVMQNLLSNAVKYTREKELAIIEVNCEESGDEWTFTVKDNGVGFDVTYKHKLFGVFQRLHRAEEFEGTGIGLANTKRIISRHGGRVWAEGAVGEGATFGFSLPKVPLQLQSGELL